MMLANVFCISKVYSATKSVDCSRRRAVALLRNYSLVHSNNLYDHSSLIFFWYKAFVIISDLHFQHNQFHQSFL